MISTRLPAVLREALEALSTRFPPSRLAAEAAALSAAYRAQRAAPLETPMAAAAYALTRMPATIGALTAVWRELPSRPEAVLDLGAGTGAAAWAAATLWPENPPPATLVETNPVMRELGESFGAPNAAWRGGDFRNLAGFAQHSLVSFSYSLGELPEREALETLRRAWPLASGALAVIEPGTPRGYGFILKVRETLLATGAHIAAPCPHHAPCPLAAPDWCHFAVRVERTRAHRLLKHGDLGYEDEKFCYVLAAREARPAAPARILRHPWQDKGAIRIELCTSLGLATRTVTRREKSLFRAARKASWGQGWSETADDAQTD
jgi:ribosomal protein RSM22 (predicted rRNA methylase)